MSAGEQFYSRAEAAVAMSVSVTTIDRWVRDGELAPTFKVSGARLIPRAAVDAFIARHIDETPRPFHVVEP